MVFHASFALLIMAACEAFCATCTKKSRLAALIALTVFAISIRFRSWPTRSGSFNFWVNLPTLDPTAATDLVHRLKSKARFNFLLGFVTPYLFPSIIWGIADHYGVSVLSNDLALIWTVTLWAMVPGCLFMRGIALTHLSRMILEKRRSMVAALDPGEYAQSPAHPEAT